MQSASTFCITLNNFSKIYCMHEALVACAEYFAYDSTTVGVVDQWPSHIYWKDACPMGYSNKCYSSTCTFYLEFSKYVYIYGITYITIRTGVQNMSSENWSWVIVSDLLSSDVQTLCISEFSRFNSIALNENALSFLIFEKSTASEESRNIELELMHCDRCRCYGIQPSQYPGGQFHRRGSQNFRIPNHHAAGSIEGGATFSCKYRFFLTARPPCIKIPYSTWGLPKLDLWTFQTCIIQCIRIGSRTRTYVYRIHGTVICGAVVHRWRFLCFPVHIELIMWNQIPI